MKQEVIYAKRAPTVRTRALIASNRFCRRRDGVSRGLKGLHR